MSRLDSLKPDLFLDGPAEFLAKTVVEKMKAIEPVAALFGDSIYPYEREDFSLRELPAIRLYNTSYTKETESWFITGDLIADILLPPEVRRAELEQVPDTIGSALMQLFRSPTFFTSIDREVPGLNELGKIFRVDKSLAFSWGDNIVPLVQLTINFKLDLRIWDDHLHEQGRTKDEPFKVTLGELKRIVSQIKGLKDDENVDPILGLNQEV